jgi:hypothetical protein
MAITTNAICNTFKKELLEAKHNFWQHQQGINLN